jgi:hypothetical protein
MVLDASPQADFVIAHVGLLQYTSMLVPGPTQVGSAQTTLPPATSACADAGASRSSISSSSPSPEWILGDIGDNQLLEFRCDIYCSYTTMLRLFSLQATAVATQVLAGSPPHTADGRPHDGLGRHARAPPTTSRWASPGASRSSIASSAPSRWRSSSVISVHPRIDSPTARKRR